MELANVEVRFYVLGVLFKTEVNHQRDGFYYFYVFEFTDF